MAIDMLFILYISTIDPIRPVHLAPSSSPVCVFEAHDILLVERSEGYLEHH